MGNFDFWNFVWDKSQICPRLVSACHRQFPDKSVLVTDSLQPNQIIFRTTVMDKNFPRLNPDNLKKNLGHIPISLISFTPYTEFTQINLGIFPNTEEQSWN